MGGCAHPHLNGRELEQCVKDFTYRLLHMESAEFYHLNLFNFVLFRYSSNIDLISLYLAPVKIKKQPGIDDPGIDFSPQLAYKFFLHSVDLLII